METFQPHPLPQNVTNFEFHLIGDMTLKQFGYLAGGLVVAYVIFVIFGSKAPIVAYPLIVLFGGSGAALAFLPIQERPLDHWLRAFIKAIFRPTRRKFSSNNLKVGEASFNNRLNLFFGVAQPVLAAPLPLPKPAPSPVPQTDPGLASQRGEQARMAVPQSQKVQDSGGAPLPRMTPNLPSSDELTKTIQLAEQSEHIKTEILSTQQQLNRIKQIASTPGEDPKVFAKQFQEVMIKLQDLNAEASQISNNLAFLAKSPIQAGKKVVVLVKAQNIPSITLTSTANIINGIITDAQGNYIEGAIVVAHDKQDLPVRALKTNKLGQFIAATPLPNGVYTLNIDKDSLVFDVVQIELKDELLQPVMISAKKAGIGS